MGELFETVQHVARLSNEHRYEEMRPYFLDTVQGISPDYNLRGVDAYIEALHAQNDPVSDIQITMTLVVETDKLVVTEWTWSGTVSGSGFEFPATGKRISMTGITVSEFVDGKIALFRQYWDNAGVLAQLTSA